MDINSIKSQFPIFSKKINGKPLVYLDSSNSSQKPMSVIKKLNDFYVFLVFVQNPPNILPKIPPKSRISSARLGNTMK